MDWRLHHCIYRNNASMSTEGMSDDRLALVEQFKSIADVGDDKSEDIVRMLTMNDFDLNNSISSYFDSGFIRDSPPVSSGVEVSEIENHDDSGLTHRRGSHGSQEVINLQNQMLMDSLLPRLPAAPRISNHWQLEVGIHSSLKEEEGESDTSADSLGSKKVTSPMNSLWVILLIIPKTLFQLIMSLLKFFFRGPVGLGLTHVNRYPSSFDYDKYRPGFRFLDHLAKQLNLSSDQTVDAIVQEHETTRTDSLLEKEVGDGRETSILSNYNIEEENYNELHSAARTGNLWFLVVLVDNDERSQAYLKSLLSDPKFDKLFNKSTGEYKENCIFVQNVNRSPEAFEVGRTHKAKRSPYLMLIANVSNSPSIMASMSIVYRSNIMYNYIVEESLSHTIKNTCKNLSRSLETYTPQLITQRIDQQEMEFARLIKQQQDDAFSLSLEKDRLKKMQKEKELERKQKLEGLVKAKETFLFHLVQSRWIESLSESDPKTKIAIKLPHGKRIIDEFSKVISLNELYMFVELKLFLTEIISDAEKDISNEDEALLDIQRRETIESDLSLDQYVESFPFSFELIQPFPKKVIPSGVTSISEVPGLAHGANLLVEYLNEDEIAND